MLIRDNLNMKKIKKSFKVEKDSMGQVKIPRDALYGPQTQRAVDNFNVSNLVMPKEFIISVLKVKIAAAQANYKLKLIDKKICDAICKSSQYLIENYDTSNFPLDVFQTGSGTSTNMNVNEVIANIAKKKYKAKIHPNDHVNMSQSSNDVIPTAINHCAFMLASENLLPSLIKLSKIINLKAKKTKNIVKTGRTHLMDAMPITFEQELSGWKSQIDDKHKTLKDKKEIIHFCATSEDINNISYALMFIETRKILLKKINELIKIINKYEKKYSNTAMISRTHGQKASPTTFGKELKVFTSRVKKQLRFFETREIYGKMNGAVGNYNAHYFVLPQVKWDIETKKFLNTLGLKQNENTTQIENHDWIAESLNDISLISNILIDFARDIWMYIMLDYIKQRKIKSEVGSSTMPHKINPINFENAEGNLEIVTSLSQAIGKKLQISRFQRDLTDSTVLRNLGVIYSHFYISITSLIKGMNKIDINIQKINNDLDESWELLAEPIQTVMRFHNIENSYDIIKNSTRGKSLNKQTIHSIIKSCDLDDNIKEYLLKLSPKDYIGLAQKLTKKKN